MFQNDKILFRPHSSQSACIRPSRLYRHSAHVSRDHRMSQDMQQPSSRLKPVPIPMSPNCDINHNSRIQPHHQDRFSRMSGIHSDTASILSPTESTVSSLLSIPVFPGYRCHHSPVHCQKIQNIFCSGPSLTPVRCLPWPVCTVTMIQCPVYMEVILNILIINHTTGEINSPLLSQNLSQFE